MIYPSARDWQSATERRALLFGMSGLGKTRLSALLRASGGWFHYSIDYRIGTRYMGEYIADYFKAEAMKSPLLRELLLADSVYISPNITFDNLTVVSAYLGKPGDPDRGGLPIGEYRRRQAQFHRAEVEALLDTGYFIERARSLYGYPHFVCDTGGSICEWVEPANPRDHVLTELAKIALMVWIEGSEAHTAELIRRFDQAPKPMAYQPAFLDRVWKEYLLANRIAPDKVDPDAFIRFTYAQALAHRQPRYAAIADHWGVKVSADEASAVRDEQDFIEMVACALDRRSTSPFGRAPGG